MDATIIQFPGGRSAPPQPEAHPSDDDDFYAWFEQNVLPLGNDLAMLEELATATDRTDFWAYARAMRDTLNSWPIPGEDE